MHFSFRTLNDGFDVYAPVKGCWGYRYAPSINYYEDGSMTALFATPGNGSDEWDWFTYKNSKDRVNWSREKVVLQPTCDSMDHYSVCDPGVVYFNGYYYLGYTSCIVSTNGGINNNVYVARSKKIDGPYEKWNGSGWGGKPQYIVYFDGCNQDWGAGEPSFTVVDGTLYMYYTWDSREEKAVYVCTADANDENWPATLKFHGKAIDKNGTDQADVVYVEDTKTFLLFATDYRFSPRSGVRIMESNDGIHFERGDFVSKNIAKFCHNMGISKRPDGHIRMSDKLMIGYAYSTGGWGSDTWGRWATRFQEIELYSYEGDLKITSESDGSDNVSIENYFWDVPEHPYIPGITTAPHLVRVNMGKDAGFEVRWMPPNFDIQTIKDTENLRISGYDDTVISIDGTKITPKRPGKTFAVVEYGEFRTEMGIYVYDADFVIECDTPEIVSFTPVYDTINVSLSKVNRKQIRGFVRFSNDTWGESYNDRLAEHPNFPPKVPAEKYEMTFSVEKPEVIDVTERGIVVPKTAGETKVHVTITGGKSFDVNVIVTE